MPFWKKKKQQPARPKQQPARPASEMPVVQVQFKDFDEAFKEGAQGYAYRWPMGRDPQIGDRIWVPVAYDDDHPAVVVGFGRGGYRGAVKQVRRFATAEEIARGY